MQDCIWGCVLAYGMREYVYGMRKVVWDTYGYV